jgi:hypothetical protein
MGNSGKEYRAPSCGFTCNRSSEYLLLLAAIATGHYSPQPG